MPLNKQTKSNKGIVVSVIYVKIKSWIKLSEVFYASIPIENATIFPPTTNK